jgi:multisubunit Na+/H+ antiporter MnhC subunit
MGRTRVRLILSFVVAGTFLAAGLYLLFSQAFTAKFLTMDGIGLGVVLAFIGGAWLWSDFVRPILRGEKIG